MSNNNSNERIGKSLPSRNYKMKENTTKESPTAEFDFIYIVVEKPGKPGKPGKRKQNAILSIWVCSCWKTWKTLKTQALC